MLIVTQLLCVYCKMMPGYRWLTVDTINDINDSLILNNNPSYCHSALWQSWENMVWSGQLWNSEGWCLKCIFCHKTPQYRNKQVWSLKLLAIFFVFICFYQEDTRELIELESESNIVLQKKENLYFHLHITTFHNLHWWTGGGKRRQEDVASLEYLS